MIKLPVGVCLHECLFGIISLGKDAKFMQLSVPKGYPDQETKQLLNKLLHEEPKVRGPWFRGFDWVSA